MTPIRGRFVYLPAFKVGDSKPERNKGEEPKNNKADCTERVFSICEGPDAWDLGRRLAKGRGR
jgi:hypothetical protein